MIVPLRLHDEMSDFPLAAESLEIDESMLSPFQQDRFPASSKKKSRKLSPNLLTKERYIVHYRNLKYYLQKGLVVTRVHRILRFKQKPWLKVYIDYNTRMRSAAKSDFKKDFYKLMNNSVFGKTQENLRNRMQVDVVTQREKAVKIVNSPRFTRSMTIHEDLVYLQRRIPNLQLNKPLYVGFTILEESKIHMYRFHYDHMRKWFDDITLCFTDTDSFLYHIKGVDPFKVMKENHQHFDFSNYPINHPYYSAKGKKQIGLFKDELASKILVEFIGLRAKCYSLLFEVDDDAVYREGGFEKLTAKGTKRCVKERFLRHEHFCRTLFDLSTLRVRQNTFVSLDHRIGTYNQSRISLTAFDTKRWIEDDGFSTLPFGHYRTWRG